MKNVFGLILCLGILSACSHEMSVTYDCKPSGATVYEQGVGKLGTCPVTVKYNTDDVKISDDTLHTDKIKVIWVSGASVIMLPTAIQIPSTRHVSVTFTRPVNFGNEELDDKLAHEYEDSLTSPEVKYVVTPDQDKSIFDSINSTATCVITGVTNQVDAQCE